MHPDGHEVDAVVGVLDALGELQGGSDGRVEGGTVEATGDTQDGSNEGESNSETVVLVGTLAGDACVEVGGDDSVRKSDFDGDGLPCLGEVGSFGGGNVSADREGSIQGGQPGTQCLHEDVQEEAFEGHALGDEHGEGDGGVEVGTRDEEEGVHHGGSHEAHGEGGEGADGCRGEGDWESDKEGADELGD